MPIALNSARTIASVCAALAAATLVGCVTEGAPLRNKPKEVVQRPGTQAQKIVLLVSQFGEDTDGNGFADLYEPSVQLYGGPADVPVPFHIDGVFTYSLTAEDGTEIANWVFDQAATRASRQTVGNLRIHRFALRVNDVANDRVAARFAALRCTFEPAGDGPKVSSRPVTVRVGALRN